MEEKNNIAEILKDKPENTKLYSPLFGDVYFSDVEDCFIKVTHHGRRMVRFFDNGIYYNYPESEPLLFPSREMRDWRKFAWKKGDVLYSAGLKEYCVFNKFISDGYLMFISNYNVDENTKRVVPKTYDPDKNTVNYEKVSDEKANEIISLIEEHYGGKLNLSTLEIEKQPEFKDGDIVFVESHMLGINTSSMITVIFRKEKENDKYKFSPALCESNVHDTYLRESPVVLSPSDIKTFRLATDSEKQQLFDALAKYEKAWDAEKKQIVDLKPKVELKPFDKVLIRDFGSQPWQVSLFGYKDSDSYYCCNGCGWNQCIPYIGNESLLGTTKDVEG